MIKETVVLIIIASAIAMFVLGAVFIVVTIKSRPRILLRKRMNEIGSLGEVNAGDKAESRRAKRIQDKIKQLEQKTKKRSFMESIRASILQAGVDISPSTYFVISAVLAAVSSLVYLVLKLPPLGAIAVAGVMGFLLPKFVLFLKARKRQKMFTEHFANAADLIVRGIRSGLPVNECFNVIAREFDDPIGEEFRLLVEGQNLGMTIDSLLEKGIERIPTSEYKFFAIVLQIQRQTGGNLADTLDGLSKVLRDRKKMRDKAKAMASEAMASAGIIGSLPFAVATLLSIVNPEYLMVLYYEKTGNYLVMFGLFWMFLGSMVMKKMINFKM
jgi:tight adherence protein B